MCIQPHTVIRILVQVTIYRRLRIGRDGHLDQSEAYDIYVAMVILIEKCFFFCNNKKKSVFNVYTNNNLMSCSEIITLAPFGPFLGDCYYRR